METASVGKEGRQLVMSVLPKGNERLCQKSLSAARPVGQPHHAVRRPLRRGPGLRDRTNTRKLMADWQEALFKDD